MFPLTIIFLALICILRLYQTISQSLDYPLLHLIEDWSHLDRTVFISCRIICRII